MMSRFPESSGLGQHTAKGIYLEWSGNDCCLETVGNQIQGLPELHPT